VILLLLACSGGPAPETPLDTGTPDDGEQVEDPGPSELVFSFGLIADPHVVDDGDHAERLALAVSDLNATASTSPLELVFVLGDIAWADGWEPAVAALDELVVPWVPVFGDNPIQVGEETGFHEAYAAQLELLSHELEGWNVASVPVEVPDWGEAWLHNARFEHRDMRFVILDWNTRSLDSFWGETPDLHDVDGGSLPFLIDALDSAPAGLDDRVVLLSHMALFDGFGSLETHEAADFADVVEPRADAVWGHFAGHLHGNSESEWAGLDHQIVITDATWDDDISWRVVEAWADRQTWTLEHEVIVVEDR